MIIRENPGIPRVVEMESTRVAEMEREPPCGRQFQVLDPDDPRSMRILEALLQSVTDFMKQ